MRKFNKINQTAVTQPVYVVQFNRIIGGLSCYNDQDCENGRQNALDNAFARRFHIRVTDVEVSVIIKGFAQNSFFAEYVDARSL